MMKETDLSLRPEGTVCTPRGFTAGAIHVAVRTDWEKLDVGLLSSEAPCVAAAVTTRNRVPGASLVISRQHLSGGRAQAVIANAGCANASTGKRGLDDAIRLAQAAGEKLGIDPHLAVVASTGVSMYLTRDANLETLRQVAALAPGTTLAMTFVLPFELADPALRPGLERAAEGARASGTPFLSFFTPAEILALARDAGFRTTEHVSASDLHERYFAGRTDGLRPPNNAEELLVAST